MSQKSKNQIRLELSCGYPQQVDRALKVMKEHKDLDILDGWIVPHTIMGDSAELTRALFEYYEENVVSKLSDTKARYNAREKLREQVEAILQQHREGELNSEIVAVVDKQYPEDNAAEADDVIDAYCLILCHLHRIHMIFHQQWSMIGALC